MITSASVLFAVFFALFFRSLQLGSYDHMFRNVIESYTGYIQVQQKDYWDEQIVDNSFACDRELEQRILADENVVAAIPRFESFALASSGPNTKGVLVMGVDPDQEVHLSNISGKLVQYRLSPEAVKEIGSDPGIPDKVKELALLFENHAYTSPSRLQLDLGIPDKEAGNIMPLVEAHTRSPNGMIHIGQGGALIGDGLAQYLGMGIGDSIVLISQGYHATTAAGKYEIKGIVKIPLPDIDNRVVYLPLDICQSLFNAEGNLTSLALAIHENDDDAIHATMTRIGSILPDDLRVMEWRKMNELLVSQMDADNKSGMIMIGVLYLVIAFGVFGTVLMMTAERRREFGVLVAIGMQKRKLAGIMTTEMLLIGFLGILAGSLIAVAVIFYGVDHPIVFKGEIAKMYEEYGMEPVMAFQGIDFYFAWQVVIVAIMVFVAIGYPLRKIFGMKVVEALRT
jgi:ABC-type lipoprotein release transport system permease subunit